MVENRTKGTREDMERLVNIHYRLASQKQWQIGTEDWWEVGGRDGIRADRKVKSKLLCDRLDAESERADGAGMTHVLFCPFENTFHL